jgi:hypothetical protein
VIEAALAGLDHLHELSITAEPEGEAIGELLRRVDARLYLGFRAEERGGHTINTLSGGVLTFGPTPSPGPLYQGPTDRAIIRRMLGAGESVSASSGHGAARSSKAGPEVNWTANVQRGTRRCSGPGRPRRVPKSVSWLAESGAPDRCIIPNDPPTRVWRRNTNPAAVMPRSRVNARLRATAYARDTLLRSAPGRLISTK